MIFPVAKQEQRLKWAFESCKNGAWGSEPDGEGDVVCIRAADFDGQTGRLNDGERTLRSVESATFEKVALRPGDLVMEKSGGGEKQLVGRTVLFSDERPSVCSNFLARCRPADGIEPAYLNYLMLAIYAGRGTYPHIKQSTGIQNLDLGSYLDTRVAIPDLPVQQRIARFLDEKTACIDALIAKKQALLERLAEKRQALITQAVTKGLNPDVPMKPSGVDWLGEIPACWGLKRLRFNARVNPVKSELNFPDNAEVSFVPMDAVGELGGLRLEQVRELGDVYNGYTYFANGDVCIAKITPCFENGKGAIAEGLVNGVAFGTTELHVLRPSPNLDVRFLFYLTIAQDFRNHGESEMLGAGGQKRVPEDFLKNWMPPLPRIEDQQSIAFLLDEETARIDALIEKLGGNAATAGGDQPMCLLGLLSEYRSALITAAVTGQLPELNG